MPSVKSPFKDLNFPKEKLTESIEKFCNDRGLKCEQISKTDLKEIYEFNKIGIEKARLEIFHLKDGKTTIHPKVGKNHLLSTELAQYLLTKTSEAIGQVSAVLIGYTLEDIEPVIQLMTDKKHSESGANFFKFEKQEIQGGHKFVIQNVIYKDKLTVSIYKTGRLLIQGLPLSCYDELIFQMSTLLDANGLAKVISKTDENVIQLVEQRIIESNLEIIFEDSYKKIPNMIRKLLISGSTLRSIKVKLPDYTCMVFPDLRALEGVIKDVFLNLDIDYDKNIGELFEYICLHNYTLKSEIEVKIENKQLRDAIVKAYCFYHKHRHSLFHMEDVVNGSRTITTIETAIGIADDIYKLIKEVYKSSP